MVPKFYGPAITGLAGFFICAAGNIVDDLVSTNLDRSIRPSQSSANGALSRHYAFVLGLILNLVAVVLAASVNMSLAVMAVAAIGLLYLNNYQLRKVTLLGNLVVSLLAGLTLVAGGMAVDLQFAFDLPGPLIGFALVVLFSMVREIVKDVQQVEQDRAAEIKTLAVVASPQKALLAALIIFAVLVIVSFIPVLCGWFGDWYKIIAIYVVELPLLAFLIFLWGDPSPSMLKVSSVLLKVSMALGLVALVMA